MKAKSSSLLFLGSLVFGSLMFGSMASAGGGGVARPVNQTTVSTCKALDGNLRGLVVYTTDGGGRNETRLLVRLKEHDLDTYADLGPGGLSRDSMIGRREVPYAYVDDIHEVIGYRSSGVVGELVVEIQKISSNRYAVKGSLKITRAKNDEINGPEFQFASTVRCN
jgi:hypothetical protein